MMLNLDNKGLSSVVSDFDLFFIDIWGVLHNGINLYKDSVDVLNKLDEANKEYILLTNAPRPNSTVINFLLKMGLNEKKCQKVCKAESQKVRESRNSESHGSQEFNKLKVGNLNIQNQKRV